MDKKKKIEILADLFEVDESEIRDDVKLDTFDPWDSMSKLSLIVTMDEECGKKLTGEQINTFETIGDIMDFME